MASTFVDDIGQFKADVGQSLSARVIKHLCDEHGRVHRIPPLGSGTALDRVLRPGRLSFQRFGKKLTRALAVAAFQVIE